MLNAFKINGGRGGPLWWRRCHSTSCRARAARGSCAQGPSRARARVGSCRSPRTCARQPGRKSKIVVPAWPGSLITSRRPSMQAPARRATAFALRRAAMALRLGAAAAGGGCCCCGGGSGGGGDGNDALRARAPSHEPDCICRRCSHRPSRKPQLQCGASSALLTAHAANPRVKAPPAVSEKKITIREPVIYRRRARFAVFRSPSEPQQSVTAAVTARSSAWTPADRENPRNRPCTDPAPLGASYRWDSEV